MSLEQAILHGPPREMFRSDIEPEHWELRVNREVWLRLKKAHAAGAALGQASMDKLDKLTQEYPEWKLAKDESDEFPFWMGEAEGMGRKFITIPTSRHKVVVWIKQHPSSDHWNEDGWRQRCQDDFSTTAYTLFALSSEGEWPADRWRDALQAWAEDKLLKKSWRFVVKILAKAPDSVILKLEHPLSYFLEVQAKTFVSQEELFFNLINRLLQLKYEGEVVPDDDPVSRAINHPVGHMTEARWGKAYRTRPNSYSRSYVAHRSRCTVMVV
jgi:hypothetical protein